MRRYAVFLVGAAESDDIVQEVILDAWTKRPIRTDVARGWLLASVRLRAQNEWRRRACVRPLDTQHLSQVASFEHGRFDDRLDLATVIDAWRRLSPDDQELLTLGNVLELSGAEIAQITERSRSGAYQGLTRARARLTALVEQAST